MNIIRSIEICTICWEKSTKESKYADTCDECLHLAKNEDITDKSIICPACQGKGFFFNNNKGYEEECYTCGGTGKEYSTLIKRR